VTSTFLPDTTGLELSELDVFNEHAIKVLINILAANLYSFVLGSSHFFISGRVLFREILRNTVERPLIPCTSQYSSVTFLDGVSIIGQFQLTRKPHRNALRTIIAHTLPLQMPKLTKGRSPQTCRKLH
jgi:hypothetical protein